MNNSVSINEQSNTECVVGIDSALSRTGIGVIEKIGDICRAQTFVIATDATGDKTLPARLKRIRSVSQRAAALIPLNTILALIEGPALDADYGNAWDRSPVWWGIVGILLDREIPVAEIAPTTLKKWATTSGRADKKKIVVAMRSLWSSLPCTFTHSRHHECEGLAMATMCGQRLNWPVPIRGHHGDSLAVVNWPVPA